MHTKNSCWNILKEKPINPLNFWSIYNPIDKGPIQRFHVSSYLACHAHVFTCLPARWSAAPRFSVACRPLGVPLVLKCVKQCLSVPYLVAHLLVIKLGLQSKEGENICFVFAMPTWAQRQWKDKGRAHTFLMANNAHDMFWNGCPHLTVFKWHV